MVSIAKFSVIIILKTVNYPVFLRTMAWQERYDYGGRQEEWRAGMTAARAAGFGRAEIAAGRRLISFCPL